LRQSSACQLQLPEGAAAGLPSEAAAGQEEEEEEEEGLLQRLLLALLLLLALQALQAAGQELQAAQPEAGLLPCPLWQCSGAPH
jgi:hypothetical protein